MTTTAQDPESQAVKPMRLSWTDWMGQTHSGVMLDITDGCVIWVLCDDGKKRACDSGTVFTTGGHEV